MMEQSMVRASLMVLIFTFVASQLMTSVSARYLPTRSQEDRLDKLRELLKDVSHKLREISAKYIVPSTHNIWELFFILQFHRTQLASN
jgi:Na+-transporting NADH:ubiquinone oxidoreductase subunit NqrC